MGQPAWPDGAAVKAFIESHEGLTVSTALSRQLDQAAAAARAEFERRTQRVFLAETETRSFDPPTGPRGVLDLRAELATITSVVYHGTTLVQGAAGGYVPESYNHRAPYTRLRFLRQWQAPLAFSDLQSLAVTGAWGYHATEVPDDAWDAVRQAAAVRVHSQIQYGITEGATSWKHADRSEAYGDKPLESLKLSWQAVFEASVEALTRRF